jgi:hypothetical protein
MKHAIPLIFLFGAATAAGCGSSAAPPANLPTGGTGSATENASSGASVAAVTDQRQQDDPAAVAGLKRLGAELETDETGLVTAVTLPKGTVAECLKHLARLPGLKQLSLAGSEASDDDLAVVGSLGALERLDLSWTQIGDAGIARLKQLQQLESLDLSWTGISSASLADLAGLARLKRLNAEGTELADDGGKRLHEVLPDTQIALRSEVEQPDPQKPKGQTASRRSKRPRADDVNAGAGGPENLAKSLAIGREAPEIEGNDVDGVAFKLSDYRGKVVVLDFWGHW